jgi:hypothetical protein
MIFEMMAVWNEEFYTEDTESTEDAEKKKRISRFARNDSKFSLMVVKLGAGGSGLFQDAAVVGFVGGDDVVGAEFFLGVKAGGAAHFTAAVGPLL